MFCSKRRQFTMILTAACELINTRLLKWHIPANIREINSYRSILTQEEPSERNRDNPNKATNRRSLTVYLEKPQWFNFEPLPVVFEDCLDHQGCSGFSVWLVGWAQQCCHLLRVDIMIPNGAWARHKDQHPPTSSNSDTAQTSHLSRKSWIHLIYIK